MEYFFFEQNKKKEEAGSLRKKLQEIEQLHSFEKMQILRLTAMKRVEMDRRLKVHQEEKKEKIQALVHK